MSSLENNWGDFEGLVTEIEVRRDAADEQFVSSLRMSDLHGASMASMRRAMASFAIGDSIDFQHYLSQAAYLAEADIEFGVHSYLEHAEAASDSRYQPSTFDIPGRFFDERRITRQQFEAAKRSPDVSAADMQELTAQFVLEEFAIPAKDSAITARATRQLETDTEPSEKNGALSDAIEAACYLIDITRRRPDTQPDRLETIKFAADMANRMVLGEYDPVALEYAMDGYARLVIQAVQVPGNTLSILRQSMSAFDSMRREYTVLARTTNNEDLHLYNAYNCRQWHEYIGKVRRSLLARYAAEPLHMLIDKACGNEIIEASLVAPGPKWQERAHNVRHSIPLAPK